MAVTEPLQSRSLVLRWASGVAVSASFGGLVGGFLALLRYDFIGSGLCLLAAAVGAGAIGLLSSRRY